MSCSICGNRKRREIDKALIERRPLRHTASQYGTSTGALQRHRAHIHRDLIEAHQTASRAQQFARADSLLDDVRNAEGRAERLYSAAEDILERALEAEDLKTALNAVRTAVDVMGEARQYLELRGELTGELHNVADAAANVPLIRVLTVPRMPGVQTVHPIAPGALPAPESTEASRSLPAAESRLIDAPVESEPLDIPPRNRR
jgi:hypothetical protein